jgi:hypothetical protein
MDIKEVTKLINSLGNNDQALIDYYTNKSKKLIKEINLSIDVKRLVDIKTKLNCRHWTELDKENNLCLFNSLIGFTGIKFK